MPGCLSRLIFFEAAPCDLPALRIFSSLVECCSGRVPGVCKVRCRTPCPQCPTVDARPPTAPSPLTTDPIRPFKNAHPPRALHPCWQDTAARRALAQGLHGRLQDKRLLGAAGEEVVSLQGREGHIRSRACGSAGGLCVPQWHPGLSPVVRRWLHTGVAHARTSAICNHGFMCKSACATLRAGRRETCATLAWSLPM